MAHKWSKMLYSGSVRCAKQTLPPKKGGGLGCVKTLLLPKNLANEKRGGLCKTPHAVVLRRNAPPLGGGGFGYVKTLLLPKNLANEKRGGLCKTPHAVVLHRNAPPPRYPSHLSMGQNFLAPLAPWPPHRYLSKLGGGGGLGGVAYKDWARPPPPPCCAVLCCAVLCCAVLCFVAFVALSQHTTAQHTTAQHNISLDSETPKGVSNCVFTLC